jgi:hypothetical protein
MKLQPQHSKPHQRRRQPVRLTEVSRLAEVEPVEEPLKCVWSGYPNYDRDCRSRIPASVVVKAWQRDMQLNRSVEGFFHFAWRNGVWLAFGLKDGNVRGVYCPTHCSERQSREVQVEDRRTAEPVGIALH